MRLLPALLVLACAIPARAGGLVDLAGKSIDDFTFSLRVHGWTSDQSGAVQDSSNGQPGSVIDTWNDTSLSDRVYMPWLDLSLRFKEVAVRLGAFGTTDQVRGKFDDDEGFSGHVFLAGDRALMRWQAVQGTAHIEWIPFDFGSEKTIGLEVGFMIGARVTRMAAYFRDSNTGEHYQSALVGGAPDVGLSVTLGFLNCVQVEAWVAGMGFRLPTYDYRALDAGIEARLFIDSHFYVGVGYRYSYASIERGNPKKNGRLLEFSYYGPAVLIGLQF